MDNKFMEKEQFDGPVDNDSNFGRFISQVIFILLAVGAIAATIWLKSVYIH